RRRVEPRPRASCAGERTSDEEQAHGARDGADGGLGGGEGNGSQAEREGGDAAAEPEQAGRGHPELADGAASARAEPRRAPVGGGRGTPARPARGGGGAGPSTGPPPGKRAGDTPPPAINAAEITPPASAAAVAIHTAVLSVEATRSSCERASEAAISFPAACG